MTLASLVVFGCIPAALQAESVHYYLLNTARRGLDLIMARIKRLWHAITNALRSPYIAKAPKAAEDGLLLGSQDLHTTILSFVDEGSEARAARVSSAWARLRGWICELPGLVRTAVFSRDGSQLAVGTQEKILAVYDVKTRRMLWASCDVDTCTPNVVFLHDGTLAVGRGGPRVLIYDAATGARLREIAHDDRDHVGHLALSPDGATLAVCHYNDHRVGLFNVASGASLGPDLVTHEAGGKIFAVSFSPDGSTLAVGGMNSKLEFYDVAAGTLCHEVVLPDDLRCSFALAFSPDGTMVAASHVQPVAGQAAAGQVRIYDAVTFEVLRTAPLPLYAQAVTFSRDSKRVFVGRSDNKTVIYDAATLEVLHEILRTSSVLSNEISPDDKLCAIAGPTLVSAGRDHRANSISADRDNEDEDGEDSDDWEDIDDDEDSDGNDYVYGEEPVRMGRVALYIAATGERYRMR